MHSLPSIYCLDAKHAQRAFRQRKEQYIATLKSQVANFEQMASNYKSMEKENLVLREYIIQLQSTLIEIGHRDLPPAPAELTRPSIATTSSITIPPVLAPPTNVNSLHAAGDDDESPDDEMDLGAQLQVAAAAAARQIGNEASAADDDEDVKDA